MSEEFQINLIAYALCACPVIIFLFTSNAWRHEAMRKEIICRWIGYALCAYALVILCFGGAIERVFDMPSFGIMICGVVGTCLVGLGRDFGGTIRAWPLGEKTTVVQAKNLERACDLAIYASWATGIGATVGGAIIMLSSAGWKGEMDAEKWMRGGAVCLITLLLAPIMATYFVAHRMRVRRWLAEKEREAA